jgi:phospholipid/cholesterol/gamma-HCH transport system ATP-binding protein
MNSVMGIGDHILFLHQGKKWWEGSSKEITSTDNQELNDFVFATKLMETLLKK